jgi:hypothetical protein
MELLVVGALVGALFLSGWVRRSMNDDAATKRQELALRLAMYVPEKATISTKGKYAYVSGGKPGNHDVPLVWDGTMTPYPMRWTAAQKEADERFWRADWFTELSDADWTALAQQKIPKHVDNLLYKRCKTLDGYKRTKSALLHIAKTR